jgi:hypothetical protein
MMDQCSLSLTSWTATLASDDLLAILIGCSPDSLPPLGSYYDLINRLWLRKYSLDAANAKELYPYPKNTKPKSAPGKSLSSLFFTCFRLFNIYGFLRCDYSIYIFKKGQLYPNDVLKYTNDMFLLFYCGK